jgi:hypothetical protein
MTTLPSTATLKEAKDVLRAEWNEGIECPCCTQFVKLYKRKITSSMAYALILLYRYFEANPDQEWVHMNDYLNTLDIPFPVKSGDNAKLRYWDLLEEKPEQRDDGSNRAGYWKLTELGREFVEGEITVRSHAKVFNSKSYGLTGVDVTIHEALGNKFNYDELMKG